MYVSRLSLTKTIYPVYSHGARFQESEGKLSFNSSKDKLVYQGRDPRLMSALQRHERRIVNLPHEQIVYLSPDGKLLATFKGDEHFVTSI